MIQNVIRFFLPLAIAAGLTSSTATYTAPSIIETQKIDIPAPEVNSSPERLYASTEVSTLKETPEDIPEDINCSCVKYAESLVKGIPVIDAIDYPINTIEPKVGDLIKLQYYNETTGNYIYHLALIEEISETTFKIAEANFERCKTGKREIEKSDEHILGFFNPERQHLIDELAPIQKQTLWNESGWSQYNTKSAVLRGRDGEWGVAQFMPSTWKWLSQLRQRDRLSMLDKLDFEDQIEMFKYGWEKGVVWYGNPSVK